MFIFIVPRVPKKLRNSLRDELWEISKKSLINQTSKNWKAIVIGDTTNDDLDNEYFITLDFDDYSKHDKIKFALDYLKIDKLINPQYLIRFDDDDFFSNRILSDIDKIPQKFDCYFDKYHTYIDCCYLKLAQKKNYWIPNTAIHKYEHAIKLCGKDNIELVMQSHHEYWHIYYNDKMVYSPKKDNPIYFRLLTPFSITSHGSQTKGEIDWQAHLKYLNGFGPWINFSRRNTLFFDLKNASNKFFISKPILKNSHWFYNWLKYIKNSLISI